MDATIVQYGCWGRLVLGALVTTPLKSKVIQAWLKPSCNAFIGLQITWAIPITIHRNGTGDDYGVVTRPLPSLTSVLRVHHGA